ncbi:MAG: hypothetical protein J5598_00605 [Clostridia bacterium]|nr:hypothetical protein [Clostridia bacterium]
MDEKKLLNEVRNCINKSLADFGQIIVDNFGKVQDKVGIGLYNKYGFISGGYIADMLDRQALLHINNIYPDTREKQLYTKTADIEYIHQLCNLKNIYFNIKSECSYRKDGRLEAETHIILYQNEEIMAEADFAFVEAKVNQCKTKE